MKNIPMTERDKEMLEDYLNQVLKCDNETLLNHYTGAVRTHEANILNMENREYFRVLIDKLWEEILKRMK